MKPKSDAKTSAPFEVSSESFERVTDAMSQAAERGHVIVETSLKNWESEVEHYFEEFAAHSRETLDALGRCKSPMDVLTVEQQWLKSRAKAYFDSGMRFAKAFAEIAQKVPAEAAAARTAAAEIQPKT